MILQSVIEQIADQQKTRLSHMDIGMRRDIKIVSKSLSSHALIISGVRRCGKSTLLLQLMKEMESRACFYLNFESPHLFDFGISDFARLDQVIMQKKADTLFFDEIQLVSGWEMYARQKLDEGYQVIITGSNSTMLSQELGTRLTGRHITRELFPFSFHEYLRFTAQNASLESLTSYMKYGGFPEFVRSNDEDQLSTLFQDILMRDIVARYGIKDSKSLQRLAAFLFSNVSNRITATKLKQPMGIGATSTILNWFSHLEHAYLLAFLPMFSHSLKAQMINPRKVYAIDTGLVNVVSNDMTEDCGRKLENLVFLHLRRHHKEIFYFDHKGECDFVVMQNGSVIQLIQVCYDLNADTMTREMKGLFSAMEFFGLHKGIIVTNDSSDLIMDKGRKVEVVPAWMFLGKP